MKKATMMVLALVMGSMVATAQNDPLSRSKAAQLKGSTVPTYSTGGFKVLVQNNRTGKMEATTKPLHTDTTETQVYGGRILLGKTSAAPRIQTGTGSPLNVVSAPRGSLYIRTNGVVDSTLYIKSTGTDSAGWWPVIR